MKKTLLFSAALAVAAGLAHGASITVNQPAGGDLCLGKTEMITWTAAGYKGKVKIVLLKGNTTVGQIAKDVDAVPSSYSWQVGTFKGGSAGADSGYRIRVKAMTEDVEGLSGKFNLKKCDIGNPPPPPPPPPPENFPKMKTPIEIMQQPPTIQQPTPVSPPNTIVISQLPKVKIVRFNPSKTTFVLGETISIDILAENVNEATVVDESSGASYDQSAFISKQTLKRSMIVTPTAAGTWRLKVNNLNSKAEDQFSLQQQFPKPVIVGFTAAAIRFSDNEKVQFSVHVQNAEKIILINDSTGVDVDTYSPAKGTADCYHQFTYAPGHSCNMMLRAENPSGKVLSNPLLVENRDETPKLYDFTAERERILGIPTEWVNMAYRVRGAKKIYIYMDFTVVEDIPSDGKLIERKFKYKPGQFPARFRMEAVFWDGFQTTVPKTAN